MADDGRAGTLGGGAMVNRDLVSGATFTAIGVLGLYFSRGLAFTTETSIGPGLFPRSLSAAILVLGVFLVVQAARAPKKVETSPGGARVLAVIVLLAVTSVVFESLGFILATTMLLAGVLFGVERKFTFTAIAIVAVTPSLAWTLFAILLNVDLPTGLFWI